MGKNGSELSWGVERRLEFIEFRLFWEGHVNRSDLMGQFGVSVNQASTDLNRYIGFAPDNMFYDKSARTYVRSLEFNPQFLEPDASRYLAQLRSVADKILDRETLGSPASRPTRPLLRPCEVSIRRRFAWWLARSAGPRRSKLSTSPCPVRSRDGGGLNPTPSHLTDSVGTPERFA